MKVSIVVPVHNQEANLERCVTSLLHQTHRDVEILLVENGSTDRSGRICDEFADEQERVTTIHLERSGVSLARNAGVRLASGECVMFCDSDDWVEPAWVRLLHDRLLTGDFDLAVSGYTAESEASAEFAGKRSIVPEAGPTSLEVKDFYLLERWGLLSAVWNKIYLKSIIDTAHVNFEESISTAEDLLFNLRYLRASSRIGLVSESTYNYRVAAGGTLSTKYIDGEWKIATKVRGEFQALLEQVPDGWETYRTEFWSVYLEILERVTNRYADEGANASLVERVRANNRILLSPEARETLMAADWGARNPIYVRAFRSRNYLWVLLYRRSTAWIQSLGSDLRRR